MRLLLGDPSGKHLASRDGERRIGGGVTGRVAAVLTHYAPLSDVVEIGLHDTPLYNSIYRFDDQLLVNTHVYGLLAAHTPQRPAADVRKPSASVVVRDATGRVLMLRRTDNGLWTIPTGGLKKNETISACGIRECREETGIDIEITGMVGVFSDPRPRGRLPPPRRSHGGPPTLNVCPHARPTGGMLAPDPREATDVAWVHPDDLPALDVHPAIRVRLTHALTHPDTPHLG